MYLITFFSTIFGIALTILLVAGMVLFIVMNPLVAICFLIALVAFSSTFWRKKK